MNKHLFILFSFLCATLPSIGAEFLRPRNPMALMGTIQFPSTLKKIPDIRLYRSGSIIPCEVDNTNKKVSFSIMDDRSQMQFSLLITNSIAFETENNTVKFIKINPEQEYKYYLLTLKEITPENSSSLRNNQPYYIWTIQENSVSFHNGRIPDNTIILCFNPAFVDSLHGGNVVTLPTIVIKQNIVALAGSEVKLHEESIEMLLATLDYDTLHAHIKQEIRPLCANKTILTLTT